MKKRGWGVDRARRRKNVTLEASMTRVLSKELSHTPTPWEAHEDLDKSVELIGGDPPDQFKNITNTLSWEDAAFIVRAVNSHEELVTALRGVIEARGGDPVAWKDEWEYAEKTLAKVEGK